MRVDTIEMEKSRKKPFFVAFGSHHKPDNIGELAKPMKNLFTYLDLLSHMGMIEIYKDDVVQLGKDMVVRQISAVMEYERWELTDHDWALIYRSML